jgi:hypothetical protein
VPDSRSRHRRRLVRQADYTAKWMGSGSARHGRNYVSLEIPYNASTICKPADFCGALNLFVPVVGIHSDAF